jgi:hypothetical protein
MLSWLIDGTNTLLLVWQLWQLDKRWTVCLLVWAA